MPFVDVGGIRLSYECAGTGQPVLFVNGTGAAGRVWTVYQTPALRRAGYRTVVFDNRGIGGSDRPLGPYRLADLVTDTRLLIEELDLAPCRIVGSSLGSVIAQELMAEDPGLIHSAVLLATRSRADTFRRALAAADVAEWEHGAPHPAVAAVNQLTQMFSPATLRDDAAAGRWLDLFRHSAGAADGRQPPILDKDGDWRDVLRRISTPCRIVAFADDVVSPPHLAAEAAEEIPGCDYLLIEDCGHLGHLERPDEVNAAITEFFQKY